MIQIVQAVKDHQRTADGNAGVVALHGQLHSRRNLTVGVHRDGDAAYHKDRGAQCQNNELYKDLGAALTSGFKTLDQQVDGQMLLGTVGIRRTPA